MSAAGTVASITVLSSHEFWAFNCRNVSGRRLMWRGGERAFMPVATYRWQWDECLGPSMIVADPEFYTRLSLMRRKGAKF